MLINRKTDFPKTITLFALPLCMLAGILSTSIATSGEEAIQAVKKPRFEITETTLRDVKTKLEWSLQKDSSPGSLSWYNAMSYARAMNAVQYGGFRDWRLPTREELESLSDYAQKAGFNGTAGREVYIGLRQIGLKNLEDEHYWTQTENLYNDRLAWAVDLKTGIPETITKSLYENVIVVRTLK